MFVLLGSLCKIFDVPLLPLNKIAAYGCCLCQHNLSDCAGREESRFYYILSIQEESSVMIGN